MVYENTTISGDRKKATVKTSVGTWEVIKPKAGVRNTALGLAETENGFKQMVLLTSILPRCIASRPDSFDKDVPIDQVLNDLEIEDYDDLVNALGILITPATPKQKEEIKN